MLMFNNSYGKLSVHASVEAPRRERLQSVKAATEQTAKRFNLSFEVVRFRKRFSQIYVYYENGEDEPIPIYCDEGKSFGLKEISATLKNMMYVLSFHPALSALRKARKELMGFS